MKKTTIYLPDDLKDALEHVAQVENRSEADIIREALRSALAGRRPPAPRAPLGDHTLGDPRAAERVDELLEGFGTR